MPDKSNHLPKDMLERIFEWALWKSRLIVLLAVIFGILGGFGLFILGSYEIFHTLKTLFPLQEQLGKYEPALIGIIGAIDLYLIGVVLLIFSFGLYELFISKINIARLQNELNILDIGSLDELKNKVLKVVVVVLIISFFKSILTMKFATPVEMLYFALAILTVAAAVYLLRRGEKEES